MLLVVIVGGGEWRLLIGVVTVFVFWIFISVEFVTGVLRVVFM